MWFTSIRLDSLKSTLQTEEESLQDQKYIFPSGKFIKPSIPENVTVTSTTLCHWSYSRHGTDGKEGWKSSQIFAVLIVMLLRDTFKL